MHVWSVLLTAFGGRGDEEGSFCKMLINFYGFFRNFSEFQGLYSARIILMTDCNIPVNGGKECRKFPGNLENFKFAEKVRQAGS